jgi:ABC-type Fe3+/spermidine/putrescine transport system ATPase subunit
MREEIQALHRETDISFVYVTHDQVEALSLADRMAVMDRGRLRACGAPADLYHRPPNLFCADFLGESNQVRGVVRECRGSVVTVDTVFGMWQGVAGPSGGLGVGTPAVCMVRPEKIRRSERRENSNRMSATVGAVTLTGATMSVSLRANDLQMKATVLNEYPVRMAPGSQLDWDVLHEDTVVLTED